MLGLDSRHQLLFGMLALQLEFISREALLVASAVSVREKHKTLGQLLVEQGALTAETCVLLEALVQKHLALHGGDAEKSLRALRQAKDPHATRGPGDDVKSTARFRKLRPHASGGLGEVYVALDTELHREVAIKEIQDSHADTPETRQRLLMEAEITGGLEHPGIVPVYGLGTSSEGKPYYVMRFIKGDSLKEAIERFHESTDRTALGAGRAFGAGLPTPPPGRPKVSCESGDLRSENRRGRRPAPNVSAPNADFHSLDFRKLLNHFLDVCNAIAYAHSRGVVHRDLKPANIMLGAYGETLVVDWGLAKTVEVSDTVTVESGEPPLSAGRVEPPLRPVSASGTGETLAGSAIGTPQYMSPEQAAGRVHLLGPATDVYSLGATLYCVLTGSPPFDEEDLGALLRKVERGDFLLPTERNRNIPRALESVCLKAMATNPTDRYASPTDLAKDIERWLAGERVSAWDEPWTERAARWITKHRTHLTAVGVVLVFAFAGLTIANVQLWRAYQNERVARQAFQSVLQQED